MTPTEVQELVGWTPLHRAAFRGDVETVRALLDGGADADPRARDGWTPLMSACLEGRAAVARLLRDRGAKAELPEHRAIPLDKLACASGDLETARVFAPEWPYYAALFFLAAHARAGHATTKLNDAGYSDGDMVGYSSSWSETWAIRTPTLELNGDVMAYLGGSVTPLESGDGLCVGDVGMERDDGRKHWGTTVAPFPGMCGRDYSQVYIADLAPHWLGDRVLPESRLRELLDKAVRARHLAVMDALLPETGKPLDALFLAVIADDPELVARLVDDPNAEQTAGAWRGLTALGLAARRDPRTRAARVLLQMGADVERGGEAPPLLLALENTGEATLDFVNALLEHGANVEAIHPSKGMTPLTNAAFMGDARIVERLLRAGANPNARTQRGLTPIFYAKWGGELKLRFMLDQHQEIVELLLAFGAVPEP